MSTICLYLYSTKRWLSLQTLFSNKSEVESWMWNCNQTKIFIVIVVSLFHYYRFDFKQVLHNSNPVYRPSFYVYVTVLHKLFAIWITALLKVMKIQYHKNFTKVEEEPFSFWLKWLSNFRSDTEIQKVLGYFCGFR